MTVQFGRTICESKPCGTRTESQERGPRHARWAGPVCRSVTWGPVPDLTPPPAPTTFAWRAGRLPVRARGAPGLLGLLRATAAAAAVSNFSRGKPPGSCTICEHFHEVSAVSTCMQQELLPRTHITVYSPSSIVGAFSPQQVLQFATAQCYNLILHVQY